MPAPLGVGRDLAWLDLVQFVTGLEVEAVFADLATAISVCQRPTGNVETFAAAPDVERVHEPKATEVLAHSLVRFRGCTRVVRRLAGVRRPQERDPLRGGRIARLAHWDGEAHEQMWLGRHSAPDTSRTSSARRSPRPTATDDGWR